MAKHKIVMRMPPREIKRADVSFSVRGDGDKLGTLEVSNGSIVWFPANTQYGYKMGWERFDQIMSIEARRFEKR